MRALDLFSPRMFFPLSALFFLVAGIIGAYFFPQFRVPFTVVLLHFLGLAVFIAGTLSARRLGRLLGDWRFALFLLSAFSLYFAYRNFVSYFYLALALPPAAWCLREYGEKVPRQLMLAGSVLFIADLYLAGIPLLDPSLRDGGYTLPWVFAIVLFLLGFGLRIQNAGGREVLLLTILGAALLSLGGYRTPVIILVLTALACAYHRKLLGLRRAVPVLLLLVLFVALMGWFVAKPSLSPVGLLLFRAAYTNWIEGSIMMNAPAWGVEEGGMWLEYHPRFSIGEAFAGRHRNISGGFFGSLWFDSGFAGFALGSFLAGMLLQAVYLGRRQAPAAYWIAISYLAVSVETGLDAAYVAILLACLFFVSGRPPKAGAG